MKPGESYVRLTRIDDPDGHAEKIKQKWGVPRRLDIGKRNEEGGVARCLFYTVKKGDFVDATVAVDIASFGEGRQVHSVHMELLQIVQLLPASAAQVSRIHTLCLPGLTLCRMLRWT